MALLRVFSLILIVVALMLLGADVVSSLERGGLVVRSLNDIIRLFGFDPRLWTQQNVAPQLAAALSAILSWPGWGVVGLPGAFLGMIAAGSHRRRMVHTSLPPEPPALP